MVIIHSYIVTTEDALIYSVLYNTYWDTVFFSGIFPLYKVPKVCRATGGTNVIDISIGINIWIKIEKIKSWPQNSAISHGFSKADISFIGILLGGGGGVCWEYYSSAYESLGQKIGRKLLLCSIYRAGHTPQRLQQSETLCRPKNCSLAKIYFCEALSR